MKKRVVQLTAYVGMSGGVDSSVAAHLLKQQGYRVVGVFLKPWQIPGMPCAWQADRTDALRVAVQLGIELKTWDLSRQYYQHVTKDMVAQYKKGKTPNPDVLCNRFIKFGYFYRRARKEGAHIVATGHYARIVKRKGVPLIAKGRDANKDQSYFLWGLKPDQLVHVAFPIGDLTKPEVRALARTGGLITADKKDSQGVCFVGHMDVKTFLMQHIKSKQGNIVSSDGRIIGTHDGAAYYTIGQRHGLDIRDGHGPYFVLGKHMRTNTITVGSASELASRSARVSRIVWFQRPATFPTLVDVKIRYRTASVRARIDARGVLTFLKPAQAVAPGQSAVMYRGDVLVGGGILV